MSPRLLDLFCCAGGAATGYHLAGFEVVGVDISPQPRYPFEFHQADAMTFPLDGFDVIHASPPCQDYSVMTRGLRKRSYPRLIDPVRELLIGSGKPYVIENVPGSALPTQTTLDETHGLELCGTMFGLRVWRHRLFETSVPVAAPRGCRHDIGSINPYFAESRRRLEAIHGIPTIRLFQRELGIEWMSTHEASEAIPPAYTEYIGNALRIAI